MRVSIGTTLKKGNPSQRAIQSAAGTLSSRRPRRTSMPTSQQLIAETQRARSFVAAWIRSLALFDSSCDPSAHQTHTWVSRTTISGATPSP